MALSATLDAAISSVRANIAVVGLCAPVFLLVYLIVIYRRLSHVPGPFLASLTNLVRLRWVLTRKAHHIHIDLHEKYGPLVRIGPNTVSVGDPREIRQIYGLTGEFVKSGFYPVLQPNAKGAAMPGLFNTQDENLHRVLKKPIANIYSMSNLVSFEPYVNSTMSVFFKELDERFAKPGRVCDLGVWLQRFAFDVIGEITFSRRLGFLEGAQDVDGIMHSIWHHFEKAAPVGQIPWVDKLWKKNRLLAWFSPPPTSPVVKFATERANERNEKSDLADSTLNSRDFLSRFMEAKSKDERVPDWALTAWTTSNVLAGSDTTAILLRTILYNLLRHPTSLQQLQSELQQAAETGKLSNDVVAWSEAIDLPFLDACIKEAGRLHPPFGLQLERIVPAGGAVICEKRFAAGTVVGISAWVAHRDKSVFGPNASTWDPNRWLCKDEGRRRLMERSLLTFGAGHRSCIGKNISHLEVYKLIPTLLRKYEITLADPGQEWHVENCWFVVQSGFNVYLRPA
ncbi:MAG: hypothetical protein Q9209_006734 [Squamulea sp. 1 TL-2023]